MPQPSAIPISPPTIVSATASARNCEVMSERVAPIALRRPISRIRSVTLVSIMFMIPMPPTSSEMPAIEPSTTVSSDVIVSTDCGQLGHRGDLEVRIGGVVDVVA